MAPGEGPTLEGAHATNHLRDGLDGADLVVRQHAGHHRDVRGEDELQLVHVHEAVRVHAEMHNLEAVLLLQEAGCDFPLYELRKRLIDGRMLEAGGDNRPSLVVQRAYSSDQRLVDGLRACVLANGRNNGPPDRNRISSGFALIILAILLLAFSTPSLATINQPYPSRKRFP